MTYKLSELKGKIRVGDEVKFNGEKYYRKVAFFDGARFLTEDGYGCGFFKDNDSKTVDLKPCPITWDNIKVGDFLLTYAGRTLKVLDVHGLVVDVSEIGQHDTFWRGFTVEELQDIGYTIVQPPKENPIREVTMKEVHERFGEEVKIKEEP